MHPIGCSILDKCLFSESIIRKYLTCIFNASTNSFLIYIGRKFALYSILSANCIKAEKSVEGGVKTSPAFNKGKRSPTVRLISTVRGERLQLIANAF